jgi:hypothetical protein
MATVGVWQTQANRAKFSGMPVNKVARHAERSRQFTDRHEGIVSFLKSTFHLLLLSGTSPTGVTSAGWGWRKSKLTPDSFSNSSKASQPSRAPLEVPRDPK